MAIVGQVHSFPITLKGNATIKGGEITITGLAAVVNDTTPQLGGNLDCQSFHLELNDYTLTDDSLLSPGGFTSVWANQKVPNTWTGSPTYKFIQFDHGGATYGWQVLSKA